MNEELIAKAAILVLVGGVAGFLNVLAGGGSLLTLPVLIFLGLPSTVANGTNRIAILVQNIFAVGGFRHQGILPVGTALLCAAPALAGSYLGANLALSVDDLLFNRILAGIMLGLLIFTAIDPMKRFRRPEMHHTPPRVLFLVLCFFGVGVYGGFVQAGVGFLIITSLMLQGLDLVTINAVKVFVVGLFTLVALTVFILHRQVDYGLGFALAAGNAAGGLLATRMAVKKGHDWIKKVVSLTIFAFAIKLLIGG